MKQNNTIMTFCVSFLAFWFFMYVLYIGSPIIIPFVVAMLLSFIIISLTTFFRHFWVQKYLALFTSLFILALFIYLTGEIIDSNVKLLIREAPGYQERLIVIFDIYANKYGINSGLVSQQLLENFTLTSVFTNLASLITAIVKNAGMIIFFTLFILLESKAFRTKLSIIAGGEKTPMFWALEQIQSDMKSYFKIKTVTSLTVSLISLVIMFFFGLDFLVFWAFIIFILNYIPSIWSIIAVAFPVLFSLIQFESLTITIVFLILMAGAQIIIWNVIEPRLMGNKLNLSPLVILISLIFWGTIWWPVWMLLAVPMMVMMNIVFAHNEHTRPIAVLLSEKWVVKFTSTKKWWKTKLSISKMKKLLNK